MSSKIVLVFAALLVVAMAFELDPTEEEIANDVEFMKRDPYMQNYFLAEKRGTNMKRYKDCANAPGCLCTRRGNRVVYCAGAGGGGI